MHDLLSRTDLLSEGGDSISLRRPSRELDIRTRRRDTRRKGMAGGHPTEPVLISREEVIVVDDSLP